MKFGIKLFHIQEKHLYDTTSKTHVSMSHIYIILYEIQAIRQLKHNDQHWKLCQKEKSQIQANQNHSQFYSIHSLLETILHFFRTQTTNSPATI